MEGVKAKSRDRLTADLGRAVWMIVAAGLYVPLHIYIPNRYAIVQFWSHAGVFVGFFAICLVVVILFWRLGVDRSTVVYSAVLFQLFFWSGRALHDALGVGVGVLVALSLWVLSTVIIHRLRDAALVDYLFFGLAIYLTLMPWVSGIDLDPDHVDRGGVVASKVEHVGGEYRPDVFVVIFDGYPGIQTLATWDGWDGSIVQRLADRGFRVAPAWSAYTSSGPSLSGLLDASYPVEPIGEYASSARPEILLIEGGEAAAFDFLKDAGYQITFLEAPWWGSQCGSAVEACVAAPVLDYLLYLAVKPSFLGLWLDRNVGSGFIHGARQSWDWLQESAEALSSNGVPDFVLAHIVAPHEPLVLDSSCNVRYDDRYDSIGVTAGPDGDAYRAFLDQAACVDRVMLDIADAVSFDAVLIFTADHGSSLLGQGQIPPDDWSVAQLRERHSTFFAMRAEQRCQPGDPVVVQNLLRGVMRCLGSQDLPDLDLRLFPGSLFFDDEQVRMIELPDDLVAQVTVIAEGTEG